MSRKHLGEPPDRHHRCVPARMSICGLGAWSRLRSRTERRVGSSPRFFRRTCPANSSDGLPADASGGYEAPRPSARGWLEESRPRNDDAPSRPCPFRRCWGTSRPTSQPMTKVRAIIVTVVAAAVPLGGRPGAVARQGRPWRRRRPQGRARARHRGAVLVPRPVRCALASGRRRGRSPSHRASASATISRCLRWRSPPFRAVGIRYRRSGGTLFDGSLFGDCGPAGDPGRNLGEMVTGSRTSPAWPDRR